MTDNTKMRGTAVHVCQIKDSECGINPNLWCLTCPKKLDKAAHDCLVCRQPAQSEQAVAVVGELSDAQCDHLLNLRVPGGSAVSHWFAPHGSEKAKANIRDIIRLIVSEAKPTHSIPDAGQMVPVVGEPVAWVDAVKLSNVRKGYLLNVYLHGEAGSEIDNLVPLFTAPTNSITEAELERLRNSLASAERELETERMRLAACGVIALSNTVESAANARGMLPKYWSASAQDCASAVDREMDYRTRLAQAERELERLRKDAERYRWIRREFRNLTGDQAFEILEKYGDRFDAAIDAAIAGEKK